MADRNSRASILAWSTVCSFFTGFSLTGYSIFLPALVQDFHWSRAEVTVPFSVSMIAWGATQPLSGALADRWGTRPVILGGMLLAGIGFAVMAVSHELWQLALGFGVFVGGASSACGGNMYSLLISKWFSGNSRASAVGLAQAAIPASPILMAPAAFFIISTFGWRYAAVALAALLLAVAFPIAYLSIRDPEAKVSDGNALAKKGGRQEIATMFRNPVLRNLFISRIACGLGFLIMPHLAAAAIESGLTPAEGAFAVSVYGGSAMVGAFASGIMADRFGRSRTLVGTYIIRAAGTFSLALFVTNAVSFYVAVALAAGPIFGTVAINNVQIFEFAGSKRAGFMLGVSFVLHQVAAAISPYVSGVVFDLTGTYRYGFLGLGIVFLLATIPSAGTKPESLPVQIKAG